MVVIVRNKQGKLEEVYPSIAAYMESPDHWIHMDDSKYDKEQTGYRLLICRYSLPYKYNIYPEKLTPEEWQRCKDKDILR